jgi:hypothetical protein
MSLLKPYKDSNQEHSGNILTLNIKGEGECKFEKFLDCKRIRNKLVYLVKWVGY